MVHGLSVCVCVAEESWLYWTDSEAGSIWRVARDGTGRARLVAQDAPIDAQPSDWLAGLAIDWVGGNMFWSDPRRRVLEAARLDGSHRYVLLDTDPISVTCLAVDAARGWLFAGGGGIVQRARLDGSQRALLLNVSGSGSVLDIALDTQVCLTLTPTRSKLY